MNYLNTRFDQIANSVKSVNLEQGSAIKLNHGRVFSGSVIVGLLSGTVETQVYTFV